MSLELLVDKVHRMMCESVDLLVKCPFACDQPAKYVQKPMDLLHFQVRTQFSSP